ncbi:hypothetical protein ACVWXM_004558 [Bradyrhizobium sp. GM7.3]
MEEQPIRISPVVDRHNQQPENKKCLVSPCSPQLCCCSDQRLSVHSHSLRRAGRATTPSTALITTTPTHPVAGRNSFTEGQAKSKIEGAGYSNVSGLQKDDNGVWRGKADKAGTKADVSVDFQGNVNPAK